MEKNKSDVNGWIVRGLGEMAQGNLDAAELAFTKVIEMQPDHAPSYHNRGCMRYEKGDREGALADLTKAIELDPDDDSEVYMLRSKIREHAGDLDGALADLTKAIELEPDALHYYEERGRLRLRLGGLDGALADFDKFIELGTGKNKGGGYFYRGTVIFDTGDWEGSLADFRKAALNAVFDNQNLCDFNRDMPWMARFCIWLIRARMGEQFAGSVELQGWLQEHLDVIRRGDWVSKVGAFLVGDLPKSELFKFAGDDKDRICEAHFYAGAKCLVTGDRTTAVIYFKKCVATGSDYWEHERAVVALKRLDCSTDESRPNQPAAQFVTKTQI